MALTYASEWATEDAAHRFFASYHKVLEGKSQSISVLSEAPDQITGKTEDGNFTLQVSGARVSVVEGLP